MMGSKSSELLMGAGLIRYASTSSQRFKRFKKTALGGFKAAVAHEHHMVAEPGLGQHALKQFVNPAVGTARTAHLGNQGALVPVQAAASAGGRSSTCRPARMVLLAGSSATRMRAPPTARRRPCRVSRMAVGWWAKSS